MVSLEALTRLLADRAASDVSGNGRVRLTGRIFELWSIALSEGMFAECEEMDDLNRAECKSETPRHGHGSGWSHLCVF
jgi:hypothetical protein